jgi:hypothetical protein
MAITANGTHLIFNDSSTQDTAFTAGAVASAGSYANSAFATANTVTSASSYANSAFATANNSSGVNLTQNTNISSASSYANAAFSQANTGGVTSIVAGTGISISGATGAVTVTASGGGVTSLNGQTGAITNTSLDAIGSYIAAVNAVTASGSDGYYTTASTGDTLAGSALRRNYGTQNPPATFGLSGTHSSTNYNQGGTALSGTYRVMGRNIGYSITEGTTVFTWWPGLLVRIS